MVKVAMRTMGLEPGDGAMWIADEVTLMQDVPAIYVSAVKSVIAKQGESSLHKFGLCWVINMEEDVNPVMQFHSLIKTFLPNTDELTFDVGSGDIKPDTKMKFIAWPKYGSMELRYAGKSNFEAFIYLYIPDKKEPQTDNFVVEVEMGGG